MKRVTIQEARKLFDIGVVIYLLPSHTEYVQGIKISVFTNNLKDKDFDIFVNNYKSVSSHHMRYYVEEKEVQDKTNRLKVVNKSVRKADKLQYSKQELMHIGSNLASLWGAECYDLRVDKNLNKVIFSCIEAGERFESDVSFGDLKKYLI